MDLHEAWSKALKQTEIVRARVSALLPIVPTMLSTLSCYHLVWRRMETLQTRARELGEEKKAPAQDEEFVLSHSDNVQATGFVEHLKLPHYVDFQSELGLVRRMREEFAVQAAEAACTREAAE